MNPTVFGYYKDRLLTILREKAYERRKVTLTSGRESDFYIDCRKVTMTAEGHFLVGHLLYDLISGRHPDAQAVGGMELGACPIASAVSLVSIMSVTPKFDAFCVRKEQKKHGLSKLVEGIGHLRPCAPVAIVEDVVTTGGSLMLAVERVEQAGLWPVGVFALVDRCEGGREVVEKRLPMVALYEKGDFAA